VEGESEGSKLIPHKAMGVPRGRWPGAVCFCACRRVCLPGGAQKLTGRAVRCAALRCAALRGNSRGSSGLTAVRHHFLGRKPAEQPGTKQFPLPRALSREGPGHRPGSRAARLNLALLFCSRRARALRSCPAHARLPPTVGCVGGEPSPPIEVLRPVDAM
jgi:hypothetical protein